MGQNRVKGLRENATLSAPNCFTRTKFVFGREMKQFHEFMDFHAIAY